MKQLIVYEETLTVLFLKKPTNISSQDHTTTIVQFER